MGDFLDKYTERGLLSYLDVEDDLEALLPGPSEQERNESRLRKVITGEKRPLSHKAKEAGAWVGANAVLPLIAGALKGADKASKAGKGVAAIKKAGGGKITKKAMKTAKEIAEKEAKKAAEEVAKAKVERRGGNLFMTLTKHALADKNPVRIKAGAAKELEKNVNKSIKMLNKYPSNVPVEDIIKKEALKSGKITTAATGSGVKAGDIISNGGVDTGDYDKLEEDVKDYDNSIEMGKGRKAWQFIKGLFDLDDLNPDIYPMEQVNAVLNDLNKNTNKWRQVQINRLGDDEKIKLIKDIANGKYDTDKMVLSRELYKSYMNLTNKKEENK